MLASESDIVALIESDVAAMETLHLAESLDLPDWWIGAGFVRNRVWDALSGHCATSDLCDVDLVYFDRQRGDEVHDLAIEAEAHGAAPDVPWEIRNQARMHLRNGEEPYVATLDAIAKWPETATCVGVTLDQDQVRLSCCHGVEDLLRLVVRPSPAFDHSAGRARIRQRVEAKAWQQPWPTLQVQVEGD